MESENKNAHVTEGSIVRSYEVPGRSNTDGRPLSTAGKSNPNLSVNAIAKAKKALQLQHKGLAYKLKKLPLLNKGSKSTSEGSPRTRVPSTTTPAVSTGTSFASAVPHTALAGVGSIPNIEAVKLRSWQLRWDFVRIQSLLPGQAPSDTAVALKPTKAPILRVDALGREIEG